MSILKKQSLVDQIYDQIKETIITLAIPLGGRINVSELQEQYGVSSTPIREAINRLSKEGLVEYENNVGARVIEIGEKDVIEIQNLAMTLHTAAIHYSMENGDHKGMAALIKGYIGDYKSAKNVEDRMKSVHKLIGVFYAHCDNSRLDFVMSIIKGQQMILRTIYGEAIGLDKANTTDFEAMYEAVLQGDEQGVSDALKRNEEKALPVILESVRNRSK